MKRYVMVLVLLVLMALPSVVSAQGDVLYGCTSRSEAEGGSMLYILDPATGAATLVGNMGMNWCTGLAFDSNGNLFAMGWVGAPDECPALYRVDRSTGAATFVGLSHHDFGDWAIPDISFRSDDVLFGYLRRDHGLGTISTGTGAVTELGPTNVSCCGNGIAFNAADVLFHSNEDALHTLNQTTGAATLVADHTFPAYTVEECPVLEEEGEPRINALDFSSGGVLYGSLNCGYEDVNANYLVTVNTANGVVTEVAATVDGLDGIAFAPAPPPPEAEFVPEWGSVALLGTGLASLAGYASLRWRKR